MTKESWNCDRVASHSGVDPINLAIEGQEHVENSKGGLTSVVNSSERPF